MANLTLTISDEVLKRARIKALERDTSVNALVRTYLEQLAGTDPAEAALRRFAERARRSTGGSGAEGRRWRREDLYDRPARG